VHSCRRVQEAGHQRRVLPVRERRLRHAPGPYSLHFHTIPYHTRLQIISYHVLDFLAPAQWGIHQGLPTEDKDASNPLNPGNFKHVKLLPDGACLFTRGMGMSCTWDSERGFGERSWRYSCVISDMKVEKMFVEVSSGGVVFITVLFFPLEYTPLR
jgi:hypothetical protein